MKALESIQMDLFKEEMTQEERIKTNLAKDIEKLLQQVTQTQTALPEPAITIHENILPLQALDGINIELVGEWYWIAGETKKHKDTIKATGARYSAKRKKWYYYEGIETARRGRSSKKSYEEIKETYGYVPVKEED